MYVGTDFGSTYTMISVWDEIKCEPRALNMAMVGSPSIPSVVSYNLKKKKYDFGMVAKNKTDSGRDRVFKGFKMMLPETEPERIAARGFDVPEAGAHTPANITRKFLENYLQETLADCGETQIDKLVVGIPVSWDQMQPGRTSMLEGRRIIRDICKNLDLGERYQKCIKEVQVVSEPAAASAYFAHHYRQKKGRNFEGRILLVDYGGGTLDITLTDVVTTLEENGRDVMEIKVLERTGAGEHEQQGEIGNAGIIYQESVVKEAIRRSGLTLERNGEFYKLVNDFEVNLQGSGKAIEAFYTDNGVDDLDDVDDVDNVFMEGEYDDQDIVITYSLMADVYNQVIRGVLGEKLDEMLLAMDQDLNAKVALVGGFGNFYLVKEQVERFFKMSFSDSRMRDIIESKQDREQAIALGAALLAADVVKIKNTAPYSIGIDYEIATGEEIRYAITYKQEIEFDHPYYVTDGDGEVYHFLINRGGIQDLCFNPKNSVKTHYTLTPLPEFKNKLANITDRECMEAAIGFSLDPSGVLSLHVLEYDRDRGAFAQDSKQIELADSSKLWKVQPIKR